MEEDVYPFSRQAIMVSVAKLAQSVGFQGINAQPLNVLADLMERYIHLVGTKTMEYAEHAHHNQADHIDLMAALKDMGTQPHSLQNLIDFTEPLVPTDVPQLPRAKAKVLGLNETNDIDEHTPEHVYPWMPSISAARKKDAEMKRIREQEAKKETEKDASDDEDNPMDNPPSAPGGARGADHHYPTIESDHDASSYPPTPIPIVPKPMVSTTRDITPPKSVVPPPDRNLTDKKIASLFSDPDSPTTSPISKPVIAKPVILKPVSKPKPEIEPPFPITSPIHVGHHRKPPSPIPERPKPPAKQRPPATISTLFDGSSSSSEDPLGKPTIGQDRGPTTQPGGDSPPLDNPPGWDSEESEPPGITDDSSDSEPDTAKTPKPPAQPVAADIRPPVEAVTKTFDSDEERRSKKAKKEAKKMKKEKKKEKKAKKREEKEKRRKERKANRKKEEKKRKRESRERSSSPGSSGGSSPDSTKTPQLSLKIKLKPSQPSLGPDGKPRKRGRPAKPKPEKEIKPRGRPPKDPLKREEKKLEAIRMAAEQAKKEGRANPSSSSNTNFDSSKSETKIKHKDSSREKNTVDKSSRETFSSSKSEPLISKFSSEKIVNSSESSSDDGFSDDDIPPKVTLKAPVKAPTVKAPPPVKIQPPPPLPTVPTVKIAPPKPKPPADPTPPPIPTVKISQPSKPVKRPRSPDPEPPIKPIKIKAPKPDVPKHDSGEPPKKKSKDKNPQKVKKPDPPMKKPITPIPPPAQIKPPIKPPIAKVIEKKKKEDKKKLKVKEVLKPPVVKKVDPPPKQKSHAKEPKKEEKKPKIEVSKNTSTATTVTVTSQGTTGITEADPKAYLVTNSEGHQVVAYFDNNVWICPKCGKEDDGSEMIGCDKCPDWYHNLCVGIAKVPEGSWFCPNCSKNKKKKVSKKKL